VSTVSGAWDGEDDDEACEREDDAGFGSVGIDGHPG